MCVKIEKFEEGEKPLLEKLKTAEQIKECRASYFSIETVISEKALELIFGKKLIMRLTITKEGSEVSTYLLQPDLLTSDLLLKSDKDLISAIQKTLKDFKWYVLETGVLLLKTHPSKFAAFEKDYGSSFDPYSFSLNDVRGAMFNKEY